MTTPDDDQFQTLLTTTLVPELERLGFDVSGALRASADPAHLLFHADLESYGGSVAILDAMGADVSDLRCVDLALTWERDTDTARFLLRASLEGVDLTAWVASVDLGDEAAALGSTDAERVFEGLAAVLHRPR